MRLHLFLTASSVLGFLGIRGDDLLATCKTEGCQPEQDKHVQAISMLQQEKNRKRINGGAMNHMQADIEGNDKLESGNASPPMEEISKKIVSERSYSAKAFAKEATKLDSAAKHYKNGKKAFIGKLLKTVSNQGNATAAIEGVAEMFAGLNYYSKSEQVQHFVAGTVLHDGALNALRDEDASSTCKNDTHQLRIHFLRLCANGEIQATVEKRELKDDILAWNKILYQFCKDKSGVFCQSKYNQIPFCFAPTCTEKWLFDGLDCSENPISKSSMLLTRKSEVDTTSTWTKCPGGCCSWCQSDLPKNGKARHCPPGDMAWMCGHCPYCNQGPTPAPPPPPPSPPPLPPSTTITVTKCPGGCCSWCQSDLPKHGKARHCPPGDMAWMCGDCPYCNHGPTPAPPPPPPLPPSGAGFMNVNWNNYYNASNPLGIKPDPTRSNNYFLIIGDWGGGGCTASTKNCQIMVAQMMQEYVSKMTSQGKKLLFVAALGDNFYGSATQANGGFNHAWKTLYSEDLLNVPWLATLGNHDFDRGDPHLGTTTGMKIYNQPYGGIQLNSDKNGGNRPADTQNYWLPDYNYHYELPDIGLEVISTDMNAAAHAYFRPGFFDRWIFEKRMKSGLALLEFRGRVSTATDVLLIQHYPSQRWQVMNKFKAGGAAGGASIISAYGHTHSNWDQGGGHLMIGAGGGYRSDNGGQYGFAAVNLQDGKGWTHEIFNKYCYLQSTC